jgi:hypothetical protein
VGDYIIDMQYLRDSIAGWAVKGKSKKSARMFN